MTEVAWAAAFNEEGTDESNLQGAIVKKIIDAAQATGEEMLLIPSRGKKPSAGKEWRTLVTEAQLTPLELNAFTIWLEDRWGEDVANVFREPIKEVALSRPMPKAPPSVRTARCWELAHLGALDGGSATHLLRHTGGRASARRAAPTHPTAPIPQDHLRHALAASTGRGAPVRPPVCES